MKKNVILVLLLLTALVGSLGAQQSEKPNAPQSEEDIVFTDTAAGGDAAGGVEPVSSISVWNYVFMVLVLAGVVAAIYGLFFLLKRMSGGNFPDNDLIRILSTKSLSSTRGVHLIALGKRYLLVGSAENSVNLIAEIDDKESRDEIEVFLAREDDSPKKSFKALFGGILSGGENTSDQSVSSSALFLKNQGRRMKNL